MTDLYFNELSVDYTYSTQPQNKSEIKELLLKFIETYFAYKTCYGGQFISVLSKDSSSVIKITGQLNSTIFFESLDELEEEDKIDEIEKMTFKSAISETFMPEWNPEFSHDNYIVYGLGAGTEADKYAISYITVVSGNHNYWDNHEFEIKQTKIHSNHNISESPIISKNLSSDKHVVINYSIWKKCLFVNNNPTKSLLPRKNSSKCIVKSFAGVSWDDYYSTQQSHAITTKKKIGEAIAKINGWEEYKTSGNRKTFKAENRYIAIDTENSTFEYYIGKKNHQGEFKFNDEEINTNKIDKTRKIN